MPDPCPCQLDPLASRCGEWAGNVSLCACAEDGLVIADDPAPA